jgi:hypothetical protein
LPPAGGGVIDPNADMGVVEKPDINPEVDNGAPDPNCDPNSDELCQFRHVDDDNSCAADGCGNRAEFRRKFAELPPIEAPENAEPDDIIAEAGGAPPPGKQFHNLHFTKVSDNDVAGGGIRYVEVTTLEVDGKDRVIDCIVTSSGYAGFKPEKNGLAPGEKMGQVNIMHSTSVAFTFSFVFQDTGAPATLGEFFWSVFDMDTGKGYKRKGKPVQAVEKVTVSGYKEYYLLPAEKGGQIKVTNGAGGADFEGTTWGKESDNPSDPLVLNMGQAQRSVSFKFDAGRSSFTASYAVGKAVRGGRNFMFSGMTNLYFCKAPKVNLDFSLAKVMRNNLGGKGPNTEEAEGILYSNVAAVGDQQIDLEVNALEPYGPFNTDRNGLNDKFAQINMGTPSPEASGSCKFQFRLLKGGTAEPYEAEWLYFSMFDLDQAKPNRKYNPKWQESLTVSGFASQYVSDDTEIKVEQLDKKTFRYNSSQKGTGKDNPKDPMQLDAVMMRRTVTFVYRAVSAWTARFEIGLPYDVNGRNFLLAGKSSTASCDQNTYGDVVNVQNHVTPPP